MKQAILFLLLCTLSPALAQNTSLNGKITDGQSGEELIGANVTLFRNGVFVSGGSTDFEGNYSINLDTGIYNMTISYVGYQATKITGVKVVANKNNQLDTRLGGSNAKGKVHSRRRNRNKKYNIIPYESPDKFDEPVTREGLFNEAGVS